MWLDSHINLEATAGKVTGLSLDRMSDLARLLGDPQRDYPAIHITGTNGKGSTAYLLTKLLAEHGLKAGTYASPHVSSIHERLSINADPISNGDLLDLLETLRLTEEHWEAEGGERFSWFELVTAAAFMWFADEAVDVAVVEVGKLGRYDATNILDAGIAVVTNVAEDHTDGSEGWREAIAWEKAGIIGPQSTLVLGEGASDLGLREIFEAENPKTVWSLGEHAGVESNELAVGGRLLDIATPHGRYCDVFLSLNGEHQGENAALALLVAETFFDGPLSEEIVADAFCDAALPARLEVAGREPLVIFDGAHNPHGAAAAARTVRDDFSVEGEMVLVVGMTQGHNHQRSLGKLLETIEEQGDQQEQETPTQLVCCTAPSPRGIAAEELGSFARQVGYEPVVISDADEALRHAMSLAGSDGLVFVTGSLYVAGAARQEYKKMTAGQYKPR